MKKPNQPETTQLADLLNSKMQEAGLDIRQLADRLEVTYEHMRRLVRGEGLPSKWVLQAISAELKVPYKELDKLSTADKIRKRYGTVPLEITGHDPSLEPLERIWPKLSAEQQGVVIDTAKSLLKRAHA